MSRNYETHEYMELCVEEADKVILEGIKLLEGSTYSSIKFLEDVMELIPGRLQYNISKLREKILSQPIKELADVISSNLED